MNSFLWTAAIIIGVLAMLILIFSAWIRFYHWRWHRRVSFQMGKMGRLMTFAKFEERLASSSGTVIFEAPTLGWRVLWVWWTPERVHLEAEVAADCPDESPDPFTPSPFQRWCRGRYTDLHTGHAMLVARPFLGAAFPKYPAKVTSAFPGMRTVFVASALIELMEKEKPSK